MHSAGGIEKTFGTGKMLQGNCRCGQENTHNVHHSQNAQKCSALLHFKTKNHRKIKFHFLHSWYRDGCRTTVLNTPHCDPQGGPHPRPSLVIPRITSSASPPPQMYRPTPNPAHRGQVTQMGPPQLTEVEGVYHLLFPARSGH